VAQTFSQMGFTGRQGLEQSTRAMVSRAVGAGNMSLANHIALQAFVLMGGYSLLMALIGLFLTDVLFQAFGTSEAVRAEGATYMRIQFFAVAGISLRMTASAILQASGDVLLPLRATSVARVLHIVLAPFLIFGWWGFPAFGLAGAALANLFAQAVGSTINLIALFHGDSRLHLTLRGFHLDRAILWRLIKLGAPATASGMERSFSQLVLLKIVTPFGDIATAAYGMTRRIEMFANFGGQGVGQATGIMVGQNLGAGQPERARRSVGWGLGFVTVLKMLVGIPLAFFPVFVVFIFTREAEVVSLTASWLQVLALAAIFMGLGVIFQQAFNIAGDTVSVMIVTFVGVIIELSTAWLLSYPLGMGPLGIAWGNAIGMGLRAAIFVPLYFRGDWLTRRVI
ncbi:MAG: MATE family efflux transporter, partial [Chloroflexi bacterium]|nr:MATE family efflux transporter [Chloroflexota bacterium]